MRKVLMLAVAGLLSVGAQAVPVVAVSGGGQEVPIFETTNGTTGVLFSVSGATDGLSFDLGDVQALFGGNPAVLNIFAGDPVVLPGNAGNFGNVISNDGSDFADILGGGLNPFDLANDGLVLTGASSGSGTAFDALIVEFDILFADAVSGDAGSIVFPTANGGTGTVGFGKATPVVIDGTPIVLQSPEPIPAPAPLALIGLGLAGLGLLRRRG